MSPNQRAQALRRTAGWKARLSVVISVLFVASLVIGMRATSAHPLQRAPDAGGVIKIGITADDQGPFAVPGADSFRGAKMALREFGYHAGGKKIQIFTEGGDATVNTTKTAIRKLVEQDGVQILVSPLSGDEGLFGVKPYCRAHPHLTCLNGVSGAEDTTLRNPAKNFFRFNMNGAQWMAGLGSYTYNTKKYHRMALVAEDYSFPYTQVGGFMAEYCRAGGHMVQKNWVPLGTKDFSSVVSRIPKNVDGILVVLGGADSINFLKQYDQFGGKAPIVGGTITVDQTVLSTKGTVASRVLGVPSAEPIADNNPDPAWKKWVAEYHRFFPDGLNSPSLFAHGYYLNMKALLLALQKVHGDLSGGQAKLQRALATTVVNGPTGLVRLDSHHQAIGNVYLLQTARKGNGQLYNKLVKVVKSIDETFNLGFKKYETSIEHNKSLGRDNPNCP